MVNKEYCKGLTANIETFVGVREVIVFSNEGVVFAHNIKSFAVKKAVLAFLFHHLTEQFAHSANQLTPSWFVGRSAGETFLIGHLIKDVFVAVTADARLDTASLRQYLLTCAASANQMS